MITFGPDIDKLAKGSVFAADTKQQDWQLTQGGQPAQTQQGVPQVREDLRAIRSTSTEDLAKLVHYDGETPHYFQLVVANIGNKQVSFFVIGTKPFTKQEAMSFVKRYGR